jgi:hypothetical protein
MELDESKPLNNNSLAISSESLSNEDASQISTANASIEASEVF